MPTSVRRAKFDEEHQQISWYLSQHGMYSLFHFTAVSNLRRIFRCGQVYSRDELLRLGNAKHVEFGDKSFSHGGIEDQRVERYVSLSFIPGLPMAYNCERKQHLCYLVFPHQVALTSGVLFSDRNAASSSARKETGLAGLKNINFEAVKAKKISRSSIQYAYRQAEVLVPGALSTREIEYVAFRSQASLDEARRRCSGLEAVRLFRLEPTFFNFHNRKDQFSGVINARLVARNPFRNSQMKFMNANELEKLLSAPSIEGITVSAQKHVCLIQTIHLSESCEAPPIKVIWRHKSTRKRVTADLPYRRARYSDGGVLHVAATLGPDQLQPGRWSVECFLTLDGYDVKQLEIPFQVE